MEWVKSTPLKKYLVASPSMKNGVGVLMRWRDKVINERIQDLEEGKETERVDVLQASVSPYLKWQMLSNIPSLLDVRTPDGEPLRPERIRGETLLLILAGADTSGTAFCAILNYVMSSPADYSRMMAEIDAADTAGKLSHPVPKFSEVSQHCQFYVACVKEAMRLCPSGSSLFPRYVSGDQPPLVVEGRTIPVGTEVACNPYMIGRDKTLYGDDAETFRPDRWLEDGEKTKLFEKYSMVFGYSSRVCLGKDIAILELYKAPLTVSPSSLVKKWNDLITTKFFRTFKPTPCSPATGAERHGPPKLMIKSGIFVWKDLWIDIEKRK
jgi:cytochrome P450